MINELLSFLPASPVWKAGSLGVAGATQMDLESLEVLGGKEAIVIASVGDRAREVSKLVMEKKQTSASWIVITSTTPDHSWTRAFQNGFILEDKVAKDKVNRFSFSADEFIFQAWDMRQLIRHKVKKQTCDRHKMRLKAFVNDISRKR